ncbi:bifunctional hydroxymethylpyrimidine kinase/phosphomethylpyrimidine kinase [Methanosalsum natronophilum]|uniref:Bifunctional hydroxymethylpyrimidine kinase/phosphomethylpyrimidine kinase n=1 Tax=Methanosalsum natronophilum TaxID=768733 RepID=A0A3R8CDM6_9EURY|nr:MAG: bifunctional hydroxymethylpyrimidine kinase/phosphomethylpyrimidine kinase [Methanosalsum natronophilum]
MKKKPVVMSIAGSDSGGGAGIEADLKTFSALDVHGTCAITSVTSQNTTGVIDSFDLPPDVVSSQIKVVCDDMHPSWAKTGMLPTSEIIEFVAKCAKRYGFGLVVDPVMSAEAGGSLMRMEALSTLIDKLLPICDVITPNVQEAQAISGISINTVDDAIKAARIIGKKGPRYVIVTGGHLEGSDLIYETSTKDTHVVPGELLQGGTHGSGCTYSSALISYLAKEYSLVEAATLSKEFVERAIFNSSDVGKGVAPVDQSYYILDNSKRYYVLKKMNLALSRLLKNPSFVNLIPEVGSNLAMGKENAYDLSDIAAVEGRIVKMNNIPKAVGCIGFGKSSHVGRIILTSMSFDPTKTSCLNIKYSRKILKVCNEMNLNISSFDRSLEPDNVSTMDWGVSEAIKAFDGVVPDIIYDEGGMGKEPMIRIIGKDAVAVVNIAMNIADQV